MKIPGLVKCEIAYVNGDYSSNLAIVMKHTRGLKLIQESNSKDENASKNGKHSLKE